MVSKIEPILVVVIGVFFYIGISIQEEGKILTKKYSKDKKDIEITLPVGVEVNSSGVAYNYKASKATLKKRVWYLDNFWLDNRDIKSLSSKKATKDKRYIKLYKDVVLKKSDGSIYKADIVFYDTKAKRVFSRGPFFATKNRSWVRGVDFDYRIDKKLTFAKRVKAHYIIGSLKDSPTK